MGLKKRIGILTAVFVLALVLGMLSAPEGQTEDAEGSVVKAASLPVLYAEFCGHRVNPLYGYGSSVTAGCYEESLFPFTDELVIPLHLADCREVPQEVSYEVRSEDGSRLLQKGTVSSFSGKDNDYTFSLELTDLFEQGEYYRLLLEVKLSEKRTAYYYTRVAKEDKETTETLVEYAASMHTNLFDRSAARQYAAKLEPNDKTDKKTMAYVNIGSSFDQCAWGSTEAKPLSDGWLTIEAIQDGFGYFTYSYLVEAPTAEEETSSFRVKEHFTLQKYQKAMYLLRYERHMEQLWEGRESAVISSGILLGVQEEDNLQLMTSPDRNVTVFAVSGELYSYQAAQQKLTCLFSFRNAHEHELRTLQSDYAYKVMDVTDDGDVEFIVYGYMNGGEREGRMGISYLTYHADKKTLSENMYIASEKNFERLKTEVGTLFRKGNDHFLYFYLNDRIYVMDFSSGETAVLADKAETESLVVNADGTAFAWQSGSDQEFSQMVRLINLKNGTNQTTEAPAGEFVRSLGFIREDFIAGFGQKNAQPLDNGVEKIYPVNRLEILGENMEELFSYAYDDICISGIVNEADKVVIHRYARDNGRYVYVNDDVMLRGDGGNENAGKGFASYNHPTLMKMMVVPLSKLPSYLRIESSRVDSLIGGAELVLPASSAETEEKAAFYAYGGGRMKACAVSAAEAVRAAEEDYGYVTDREGRLYWCWKAKNEEKKLPAGLLPAVPAASQAVDVSGCSLRAYMSFLDSGRPLCWVSPEGRTLWIVGYEWQNALLYDAASAENSKMTQEALSEALLRRDNTVWCCGALPEP